MPLLLLIIIAAAVLFIAAHLFRRQLVRAGARRIAQSLDATFAPERQFAQVTAADFRWLDLAFYDAAEHDLLQAGFTRIADIEDVTLSKAHPDKRTFVRILAGPDGVSRAAVYQIVVGGPQGRPSAMSSTVELITEFTDGRCATTISTPNRLLDPPPLVSRRQVDTPGVPPLLTAHAAHLAEHRQAHPSLTVAPVRTLEEALAAWRRAHERARARLSTEGLRRAELQRLAPPRAPGVADEVFEAYQQQRRDREKP